MLFQHLVQVVYGACIVVQNGSTHLTNDDLGAILGLHPHFVIGGARWGFQFPRVVFDAFLVANVGRLRRKVMKV